MPLKNIICIKWGTAYGAKDVNILYAMVARNLTGDFKFTCFTDDPGGIREEVHCQDLIPLGCEIPKDVPGKWPKISLWSKDLPGLEGVALFIDLDSVIVGNIDCYFEYGDPDDVITARNWLKWFRKSGQTSVFRFPVGGNSYMLENLQKDSVNISRNYQYEQNYVTHNVKGGIKFWPEEWTKHFRVHCMGFLPKRYLRPPVLPKGARIVTFPGRPGPADAVDGRWGRNAESRTSLQHLRWVFREFTAGRKWKKLISRHFLKADWIAENWRE